MDTEIIKNIIDKNESLNVGLNYKLYTSTIILLSKFIIDKIEPIKANQKALTTIHDVCTNLLTTYDDLPIEKDNGILIKKIYAILKSNIELLKNQDESLFYKKNAKHKIITIIPGIDFRILYPILSVADKQKIWNYLKLLFIATVKLIYSSNKSKEDKNIVQICDELEIKLLEQKINVNDMKFNPFIGTENKSINIINSLQNNEDLSSIFNQLNIDKLFNMGEIKEHLHTLSAKDIKTTTDNIASMLGSEDKDVKEVCSTLVTNLIDNLKEDGLGDLYKTLATVSERVSKNIDPEKLKKTAGAMSMFVEQNEGNIKKFTEEHGIGDLSALQKNPDLLLSFAQNCLKMRNNT